MNTYNTYKTYNKWKSPKFKSNFSIYKKVKSEKMRESKKRDIKKEYGIPVQLEEQE